MQPIQLVKIVVVGLGLLIIVGLGLLVYGFSSHVSRSTADGGKDKAKAATASAPSALVPAFGEVRVPLPAGCSVVEMVPSGDRLYLRTGPAGVCERIFVIEAATGRTLGTLLLRP